MKWITQKQAKVAGKKSERAAARCSRDHWQQILDAGPRRFFKAKNGCKVNIGPSYCALCQRYPTRDCYMTEQRIYRCPIRGNGTCGFGTHDRARREMELAYNSSDNWSTEAVEAIQALIGVIKKGGRRRTVAGIATTAVARLRLRM